MVEGTGFRRSKKDNITRTKHTHLHIQHTRSHARTHKPAHGSHTPHPRNAVFTRAQTTPRSCTFTKQTIGHVQLYETLKTKCTYNKNKPHYPFIVMKNAHATLLPSCLQAQDRPPRRLQKKENPSPLPHFQKHLSPSLSLQILLCIHKITGARSSAHTSFPVSSLSYAFFARETVPLSHTCPRVCVCVCVRSCDICCQRPHVG